jgi:hypothetical protein
MVDSKLIISLLDDVRDEHEMAGHKNMASHVLEKAMVMEEYIMTRHERFFITSYKLVMGAGEVPPGRVI